MARLDLSPLQSQVDQVEPTGWVSRAATTLSYNAGTRTLTLTVGASATSFYSGAKRFTLAALAAPTATHANTTGVHYFYYDGSTTLQTSTSVWDPAGTACPVAVVYWNATAGTGICFDERHGIQMDGMTHKYLHLTQGAQIISGFAISGYNLNPVTPANADNDFDVASGVLADEDLQHTVAALTAGASAYRIWSRSGASGDWVWDTATYPFTTGATYIQYNSSGTWGKTEAGSGNWINMWVVATPCIDAAHGIPIIMGQVAHASLAAAQAETFNSLSFGTLPSPEIAALYRVTFRTLASYTTTGKVRIESVTRIVGTTTTVNQTGVSDHAALSGLTGTNVHPALSISTDTTNFGGVVLTTSETTVQAALDRLDDYVAPIASPTFTGKVTVAASAAGSAGLNIPQGSAPSAPADGDVWTTASSVLARLGGVTRTLADTQRTAFTQLISIDSTTADHALSIGYGATPSGGTKEINIGTNGAAGSYTAITLGSVDGDNSVTINSDITVAGGIGATAIALTASDATNQPLVISHGTAPSFPANGSIWTTTDGLYAQINGATVGPLGAGGSGDPVYIQSTQPAAAKYMWWDTSTSVPTLWIEDGL